MGDSLGTSSCIHMGTEELRVGMEEGTEQAVGDMTGWGEVERRVGKDIHNYTMAMTLGKNMSILASLLREGNKVRLLKKL